MAKRNNIQNRQTEEDRDSILLQRIDQMKYSLDLENMWIENVDNKVNVACAVHTGIFAVIVFLSECVADREEINKYLEVAHKSIFLLGSVVLLFAVFCYTKALSPKLVSFSDKKGSQTNSKTNYPLYFGDIADEDFPSYKGKIYQSTSKDFMDELVKEIHINARICNSKMKWYKYGLWMTFASIFLCVLSLIVHYFA